MTPNRITKKFDKLIMGAIIGGAIGSVLGLTLAPKKGKETREYIKEKGVDAYNKGKEFIQGKKDKPSFLKRLTNLVFRRNKKGVKGEELRRIPSEPMSLTVEEEEKEFD